MVKIEFEKGTALDTALQARIDAMKELKEKKVLRLTVCRKWYDMIVAGTKKEEYREIKTYWIRRLTANCECLYDVAVELSILAHIESIAKRYKRTKKPDINIFIGNDGSYTLVGRYGSEDVFSMYCSKVKGTIQ